ncbi:MAG: hypothetical protein ACREN7_07480 [Candidatus Dormibacteria bacterium]
MLKGSIQLLLRDHSLELLQEAERQRPELESGTRPERVALRRARAAKRLLQSAVRQR